MIAVEPTTFNPNYTTQDASWDESGDQALQITSMQPILFYSYEGGVAVQGIVTNSREQDDDHQIIGILSHDDSLYNIMSSV